MTLTTKSQNHEVKVDLIWGPIMYHHAFLLNKWTEIDLQIASWVSRGKVVINNLDDNRG